jgi:tRNA A-37 threonylcarbamoyl transferase component Bud32
MTEMIDRYEVRQELGRGGMATVYYAYDPRVGREVAIKILLKEFMGDPMFRQRFEREVKAVASLEHPAIVPVYDYGEAEQPYLVMRYMAGGTLGDKLKVGAMSLAEAGVIVARVGAALEQAHTRGIVHRDLKPGNILFDQYGNAFLSDFGIVKLATGTKTLTDAGGLVGTPAYMSPEQVQGSGDLDGRSDIYSLGVILYEVLAGVIPYDADTPMGVAVMHVTQPVPRIRAVVPDIPKKMETIIAKAMAKDREDRYQMVNEMVEAVLAVTGGDLKTLMQSGTVVAAGTGPLGQGKSARPTDPGVAPTPAVTMGPGTMAVDDSQPGTQPSRATLPLPASLNAVPVWAWAAGAVVLLIVIGALVIGGLSGGAKSSSGGAAGSGTPGTPGAGETAAAAAAGGPHPILFVSDRLGTPSLFLMDPDGGNQTQVLSDEMNNRTPVWSPDGTQIAYRCQTSNRRFVCIVNADGSGRKVLTDDQADNYSPAWSPDGKQIAFVSTRDHNPEIYVMDADGSNQTRLTSSSSNDFDPAWSPDGKQIVFDSNRNGGILNLWIMNVDSSNQAVVVKERSSNYKANWSPDGKTLLFVSERDGNPEIYTVGVDGTATKRLTDNEAADISPEWSFDGTQILFSSRRDGDSEIYIMDADGSNVKRLTNSAKDDYDPVFKP